MSLLLDPHTLLWFHRDDTNLSAPAKALIADPANHKFVSAASCWEKDSFDRLLAPQSMLEGLPLVGIDVQFDAYGVH